MSRVSPFLGFPGAVEYLNTGVASHYGNPIAESRALEEGKALVDLSHEGVIKLEGPDRLTWLNSMTSQKLDGMRAGDSSETLFLSPQGRVEYAPALYDDGEASWLLVTGEELEGLIAFLTKMRFMMRVEITDESDNYAQLLTLNDELATKIAEVTEADVLWRDPWGSIAPGGHQYATAENYSYNATRVLVPRQNLAAAAKLVKSGSAALAGLAALNAVEIKAWRPGLADVDERTIPHELDWMRSAVHLTKGCYRGQETVAKVHNLGHPPRRLVMLLLDGADGETPDPGALIYDSENPDKPVGRVTRAAIHHDWGVIALALLKRRTAEDATLEVDLASGTRCTAQQEIIVPTDAGATRNVPRLTRHR